MIIVRLRGGLGNQMFQYAAGRRLSAVHQTVLKLDLSWFGTQSSRPYSLSSLNIQESIASPEEGAAFTTVPETGFMESFLRRLLRRPPRLAKTHIVEKHFSFDPNMLNVSDNIYLDGYWQSERYFKDIAEIIRREFTPKHSPKEQNQRLAKLMSDCASISVHIRRSDYVSDPKNIEVHGICSTDYYAIASARIAESVSHPHFFVFSDDPGWAREHFHPFFETTLIDHNKEIYTHHEDLWLMSRCKHNIIANSSFSWWGAWLNANPGKIVLSPKRWFNHPNYNTKDLIPAHWLKI